MAPFVALLLLLAVAATLSRLVPVLRGEPAAQLAATGAGATAPAASGGGFLAGLHQRRWARWGLSLLSLGLAIGAVAMLGYPVYTNWYADREQGKLTDQLASPELRADYLAGDVAEGDSLTRIRIPAIDVDVVVVEGTSARALRAGAGHYPTTPLPCEVGNVAIAGHRTTYGRPFHNVDLLEPGDEIVLETPVGSCTYTVSDEPWVTGPSDISVLDATADPSLTLTTCHPKGSARERLIVRAQLQGSPTST